jgi:hypothetical protein
MKSKYCFDLHVFYHQGVEHFFMCLLAILPLPLRIPCLIHVPISSLGCWFFWSWVFWVPCRFWILVPYTNKLAKIFSHSMGCLLSLLTISFAMQNAFSLMESPFVHCFS